MPVAVRRLLLSRLTVAALLAWACLVLSGPVWAGPGAGFLWEVKGRKPVHLLGSIHVAEPDFYPLDERVEQAFAASELLVVEADVTGRAETEAARLFVELGMLPAGEDLESRLSQPTLKRLAGHGVDLGRYGSLRPWALAMALQSQELARLGYDPALGVDRHFLLKAKKRGLDVEELEGVAAQYKLFAGMEPAMEEAFLVQTRDELDESGHMARRIVEAWRDGDAETLERAIFAGLVKDSLAEPIYERIFFARNRAMAEGIKACLENGRAAFVVLGAGHLVGERGVVALLREMGYTVTSLENRRRAETASRVARPEARPAAEPAHGGQP